MVSVQASYGINNKKNIQKADKEPTQSRKKLFKGQKQISPRCLCAMRDGLNKIKSNKFKEIIKTKDKEGDCNVKGNKVWGPIQQIYRTNRNSKEQQREMKM